MLAMMGDKIPAGRSRALHGAQAARRKDFSAVRAAALLPPAAMRSLLTRHSCRCGDAHACSHFGHAMPQAVVFTPAAAAHARHLSQCSRSNNHAAHAHHRAISLAICSYSASSIRSKMIMPHFAFPRPTLLLSLVRASWCHQPRLAFEKYDHETTPDFIGFSFRENMPGRQLFGDGL